MSEIVTLTGEVAAVDPATRHVTLRGPLGGEVSGTVQTDVKNLDQVNVGDIVTIIYYQSTALSATKQGEPNPLFTGGEAETASPGEKPAAYASTQTKRTVTVFSVDAAKGSVVFEGEDGTLFPVEVKRPEFVQKLQGLRTGDKIDVVVTEAVITGVTAAQPGDKPSVSYGAATVVVDNGEVVRRMDNVLFIRNEHGRMIKVKVDPKFKFMLDGQEATVEDVKPGTKLHRTAFRVVESVTYEAE
jgi:Cu/Ag efflux protein CusF